MRHSLSADNYLEACNILKFKKEVKAEDDAANEEKNDRMSDDDLYKEAKARYYATFEKRVAKKKPVEAEAADADDAAAGAGSAGDASAASASSSSASAASGSDGARPVRRAAAAAASAITTQSAILARSSSSGSGGAPLSRAPSAGAEIAASAGGKRKAADDADARPAKRPAMRRQVSAGTGDAINSIKSFITSYADADGRPKADTDLSAFVAIANTVELTPEAVLKALHALVAEADA